MNSLLKRAASFAVCIALLLLCVIPVYADINTSIDVTVHGSISVTLTDGEGAISGAEITLYRIADAEFDKSGNLSNLTFTYVDSYKDFGGVPGDLTDRSSINRLANFTQTNNIRGTARTTDENGYTIFPDLEAGMYLAVQTSSVEGFTTCSPFVVALPVYENGHLIYDIDATPKTDVLRLVDITVKKMWTDGLKNHPNGIKVELLHGEEVRDTVVLNETNGWKYLWENLPADDMWSVKEVDTPDGYVPFYNGEDYGFTVTNASKLIQTGQHKLPVIILAVAGVLFFALGSAVVCSGNKKRHE